MTSWKNYLIHNFNHLLLIISFVFAISFFFQQQPITSSDLGRHLTNGKIILQKFSIPRTNTYSYSHPNFPVITHHWGAGVIFHQITTIFGINGLHLTYIALTGVIIMLGLLTNAKQSELYLLPLVLFITIPLIADRTQIRPEIFTYLFTILYIFILERYRSQTPNSTKYKSNPSIKPLLLLPILQIFWVNTHIQFILGPFIVLVYWINHIVGLVKFPQPSTQQSVVSQIYTSWTSLRHALFSPPSKLLFITFTFTGLASLVNPFGLSGAFAPLTILSNYGYEIGENQTVFEYLKYFNQLTYIQFIVVCFTTAILITQLKLRQHYKQLTVPILILSATALTGFLMVRNIALFGYVFLIFGPQLLSNFFKTLKPSVSIQITKLISPLILLFIIVALTIPNHYYHPTRNNFGLGFTSQSHNSINFITTHPDQIRSPILNNFDVGGYLTYYLYPRHQVFVDNRPEAYPSSFFTDTYIPMQQDEAKWQHFLQAYQFNTIFFSKSDLTPWAYPFIQRRIADPDWRVIYQDDLVIILTRS